MKHDGTSSSGRLIGTCAGCGGEKRYIRRLFGDWFCGTCATKFYRQPATFTAFPELRRKP